MWYVVDFNVDLGESICIKCFLYEVDIFFYLFFCNIVCGFYGGDLVYIEKVIWQVLKYGLCIGVYFFYFDWGNFGWMFMELLEVELQVMFWYQVSVFKGMVESFGGYLFYIKLYGVLYYMFCRDEKQVQFVVVVFYFIDFNLYVMGLFDFVFV